MLVAGILLAVSVTLLIAGTFTFVGAYPGDPSAGITLLMGGVLVGIVAAAVWVGLMLAG